jgi:hypothetical protein
MVISSSHVVIETKPVAQACTLYSLAEYCPGLPREANIIADNQYMGVHPYRMLECLSKYDDVGKRTDPNIEATITALITYGAIPNREQTALEDRMDKVQEITNKYFQWSKSWPFLAAHRLLTMQLNRCNHIKRVLMELLNQYPLNSANNASFTSSFNSGNSNPRFPCRDCLLLLQLWLPLKPFVQIPCWCLQMSSLLN